MVEITDLSRIWAEDVDRDQIIVRAGEARTSIDPSEDEEQYNIFLDKLNSALRGDQDTSLEISDVDDGLLELDLQAPLPAPLPGFKWTMQLRLQPGERLASEVVAPLILQASSLQHQIKDLIERLHEKDRVISKICDRLETSGNDLTTVFPGVSNVKKSRKKSQREQLARHVKGLLDFDEDSWRGQGRPSVNGHDLSAEIIGSVFSDVMVSSSPKATSTSTLGSMDTSKSTPSQRLSESFSRQSNQETTQKKEQSRTHAIRDKESGEQQAEEDEFQRQKTPPHLQSHSPSYSINGNDKVPQVSPIQPPAKATHAEANDDDDSSTDDEADLDSQPRASSTSHAQDTKRDNTTDRLPSKGLGRLGGRTKTLEEAPPVTDDTMMEDAATGDAPPPSEQTSKRKLGAIGGKKVASNPPATSASLNDEPDAYRKASAPRPKLGAPGGKKADIRQASPAHVVTSPPQEVAESSPDRTAPTAKAKSPELPSETPEEMADRKRNELKRELEDRAKAPAKKKRKF